MAAARRLQLGSGGLESQPLAVRAVIDGRYSYTESVSKLLETLAAELERPRELSARVVNYIGGTYDIDPDAVGSFLVTELPKLEDYELDLVIGEGPSARSVKITLAPFTLIGATTRSGLRVP